jgi:hypothetical protein
MCGSANRKEAEGGARGQAVVAGWRGIAWKIIERRSDAARGDILPLRGGGHTRRRCSITHPSRAQALRQKAEPNRLTIRVREAAVRRCRRARTLFSRPEGLHFIARAASILLLIPRSRGILCVPTPLAKPPIARVPQPSWERCIRCVGSLHDGRDVCSKRATQPVSLSCLTVGTHPLGRESRGLTNIRRRSLKSHSEPTSAPR